jgi:hypothetical protein
MAFVLQDAIDVVNREVLLPESDDTVADRVGFGSGSRSLGWLEEEGSEWILAELVNEDAEAAVSVAKAFDGLGPGKALDKECP